MKTIACLVVGGGLGVLRIQMDEEDTLLHLMKQLGQRREDNQPSCDYKLFLAKRDDSWLQEDDPDVAMAAQGELPQYIRADEHPFLRLGHVKLKLPNSEDVQNGDIHFFVVVPPDESRSHRKNRNDSTPWITSLAERVVDELPLTRDALRRYLRRELSEKMPLSQFILDRIETNDPKGLCVAVVHDLFTPNDGRELATSLVNMVACSYIAQERSGIEGASKATYFSFWDSLILVVISIVSHAHGCRYLKDTDTAALYRPDVGLRMHNRCVFRGEEEARGGMAIPLRELDEKLIWRFGDAPYVFGYAVTGLDICLVAIRRDDEDPTRAKSDVIQWYNMGQLHERLALLLALLNLSTLFQPLVERMPPISFPEYGFMRRPNGVCICFAENCVKKDYPPSMIEQGIITKLETILSRIHSVPNVVRLVRIKQKDNQVILRPLGVRSHPTNTRQLVLALRDILQALAAMHAIGLMHRDLRWENVLAYDESLTKWFLIDFDDAAEAPAPEAASHFDKTVHAPEMEAAHSMEVDVYGLGQLAATTRVQDLPPQLLAIKQQCLQNDPKRRPTAASLLEDVERIIGNPMGTQ